MGHEAKLTLLSDLVDRMSDCCEDWRTADGAAQERLFAEHLRRDMAEFRRVCEALRHESAGRYMGPGVMEPGVVVGAERSFRSAAA